MERLSRRKFLKRSVIAIGGLTLASTVGCVEEEYPQDQPDFDEKPAITGNPLPVTSLIEKSLTPEDEAKINFESVVDLLDKSSNSQIRQNIGELRLLQAELEDQNSQKIRFVDSLTEPAVFVSVLPTEEGSIPIIAVSLPGFSHQNFSPQEFAQDLFEAHISLGSALEDPERWKIDQEFRQSVQNEAERAANLAFSPVY